jgi:hypothetical protein
MSMPMTINSPQTHRPMHRDTFVIDETHLNDMNEYEIESLDSHRTPARAVTGNFEAL